MLRVNLTLMIIFYQKRRRDDRPSEHEPKRSFISVCQINRNSGTRLLIKNYVTNQLDLKLDKTIKADLDMGGHKIKISKLL